MKIILSLSLLLIGLFLSAQNYADRIPFLDGDKWGYADNNGDVVIEAEYDQAFPFCEGAAKVMKNGFFGLIDKNGAIMVPVTLEGMGEWREGMIDFSKGKKYGFYDTRGNRIVSAQYL
ncbi:MAG: hypothetical protein DRJ15_00120, partial [Bacteroidetes bacterium]